MKHRKPKPDTKADLKAAVSDAKSASVKTEKKVAKAAPNPTFKVTSANFGRRI